MIYVIVAELENCVGGNLRPVRHRAVSPHQKQVQPGVGAPHHSNWLKDYQKQLKAERWSLPAYLSTASCLRIYPTDPAKPPNLCLLRQRPRADWL